VTAMARKLRFLVSGTDTGVGKTTVACALASGFTARAMRVAVMKPAETGCELRDGELIALDALALRAAALSSAPLELICPYRYPSAIAPAAAADLDGLEPPDLGRIRAACEQLAHDSDIMLVEGAGGIAVPLTWRENYADAALELDLELILVVPNRLGCLNGAVLSLDYATRRGVRVKGYILHDVDAAPSLAARTNVRSLGRLTPAACLGAISYGQTVVGKICERLLG